MTQAQRDIKRKLKVLEYARECGNVAKACRYFGISRQCYYNWLHTYEREGEAGLVDSKPCPENHKLRTPNSEPGVSASPDRFRLEPYHRSSDEVPNPARSLCVREDSERFRSISPLRGD